jgi:PAS domain S-box-containing protein
MAQSEPIRILYIEDDPGLARLVQKRLGRVGYTVDIASDGEEGIAKYHADSYDVVFVDQSLPVYEGLEVIRILGSQGPLPPTIMITGTGDERVAVEAMKLGAGDYIVKDVEGGYLDLLPSVIEKVLDQRRAAEEKQQAEEALQESEERFRQFFENEPEYCYMVSPEGIILDVNAAALTVLGYKKGELVGKTMKTFFVPESVPKLKRLIVQWRKMGSCKEQETHILTKDGARRAVMISAGAVRDKDGNILCAVAVLRDVTEHKRVKETLQKTEEHLRTIFEGASDGFSYMDRDGIILFSNKRMKEILADPHPEGKLLSAFCDQENRNILARNLKARWEGKGTVYEIVLTDAVGRRHNLLVSGTPYRDKLGVIQGAFGIYHDVTEEREAAEILSGYKEALKDSFFGIAEALSKVIEDRDPYTSGHSTGVAGLAETIARAMRFPEEQIIGIYIAGVLHDIGKMAVPVEILVKPGRLTDMEMSLIQMHPQAGYEILKGIDFPWPVAQATLQHHERMNGSGYPHGLKGDEIIPEARILAVADVVDAMTHHRPYRPAFSLQDTVEEIKKGRGRFYDPQVVDACFEVWGGEQPFVISEYSMSSTSPLFRSRSKNSSALPTTTMVRASGRR